MLEKDIEIAVCHYLRSKNIFFWKQPSAGYFDPLRKRFRKQSSPYAIRGVPDLIAVVSGRFMGFEIKSPKGRQSPHQKEFEQRLTLAGGRYFIIRNLADIARALGSETTENK